MSTKLTKKVVRVSAYSSGMVRVKFHLTGQELKELALPNAPSTGAMATAVLQAFEWDAWVSDEKTAPKVFGTVTFEVDSAIWAENKKKPGSEKFVELVGFMPTDDESTGRAVLPNFEGLLKLCPQQAQVTREVKDI